MDKSCEAPGGGLPEHTPVGTPNVTCTITVTNTSALDAFNVTVHDSPAQNSTAGNEHFANGNLLNPVSYPTPVTGTSFLDGAAFAVTPVANYPTSGATWVLDLDAGQTQELSYQFRIDGWSDLDALGLVDNRYNPQLPILGVWENTATLDPWESTPGGDKIGPGFTDVEEVRFAAPLVFLSKRPFVEDLLVNYQGGQLQPYDADGALSLIHI